MEGRRGEETITGFKKSGSETPRRRGYAPSFVLFGKKKEKKKKKNRKKKKKKKKKKEQNPNPNPE